MFIDGRFLVGITTIPATEPKRKMEDEMKSVDENVG